MNTDRSKLESPKVEVEIEINASQEDVWQTITDAEELERWFPLGAQVEPKAGGSVQMSWRDHFVWNSRIAVWDPHKHLKMIYNSPADFIADPDENTKTENVVDSSPKPQGAASPLAMDFYLEGKGGKTSLRLVHSGFDVSTDWKGEFDSVSRGWQMELLSLRHYIEQHRGTPRKVAWAYSPINCSTNEAWRKLVANGESIESLKKGDPYKLALTTGDEIEGNFLYANSSKDFSGTAASLNDAIFRIWFDEMGGQLEVNLWMATYGLPEMEVTELEQRWKKQLRHIFNNTQKL